MNIEKFKRKIEETKRIANSNYTVGCTFQPVQIIYIHPNLKTVYQNTPPENKEDVGYFIALLNFTFPYTSNGTYLHSVTYLVGFYDAEYNEVKSIPLVDDWEIFDVKRYGGVNANQSSYVNLLIRNLSQFVNEYEIQASGDFQKAFNLIWEHIGIEKAPESSGTREELKLKIEQLEAEKKEIRTKLEEVLTTFKD